MNSRRKEAEIPEEIEFEQTLKGSQYLPTTQEEEEEEEEDEYIEERIEHIEPETLPSKANREQYSPKFS